GRPIRASGTGISFWSLWADRALRSSWSLWANGTWGAGRAWRASVAFGPRDGQQGHAEVVVALRHVYTSRVGVPARVRDGNDHRVCAHGEANVHRRGFAGVLSVHRNVGARRERSHL